MAEKKPTAEEEAGQKKTLMIACTLLVVGGLWFIYQMNPGGALRQLTEQEKKELKEAEDRAREAERSKRHKRGGH